MSETDHDQVRRQHNEERIDDDHHLILRVVARILIPFIPLLAFYVQFHGDFGPGGGFQAGVILAVTVILHALIFGVDDAMRAVPPWFLKAMLATGVLLYAGTGVVNVLLGYDFLDYDGLHPNTKYNMGQHYGILVIELGILFTVASSMALLFYAFASREPEIPDEEW